MIKTKDYLDDIICGAVADRELWRGCIRQSIQDLLMDATTAKARKIKQCAEKFLFFENEMYDTICELGGYDPVALRRKIERLCLHAQQKNVSLKNDVRIEKSSISEAA